MDDVYIVVVPHLDSLYVDGRYDDRVKAEERAEKVDGIMFTGKVASKSAKKKDEKAVRKVSESGTTGPASGSRVS